MWVKICGTTSLEDAQLAAESGADAVGFVFAESRRRVTPEQVAAITPHVPQHIERVGVFYSHDPEEIAHIVRQSGLNAVQLHGGVDPQLVDGLRRILPGNVSLIQTVHW